jgi:O-antigen/teichoic acid export membrane protein
MRKTKSLLNNTFYQLLYSATNIFLLILLILAGRFLGDEIYGKFSFALASVFFLDPILDPGLSQILLREIAKQKELAQKYLSNALGYLLRISFFCYICLAIIAMSIGRDDTSTYAILILAGAGILKSVKAYLCSALEAFEYFDLKALSCFLERALLLAIGALVLINGGKLIQLCLVFFFVRSVDLLILIILIERYISKVRIQFEFRFLKSLLVEALPVGLFAVVFIFYSYIDTVMISFIRGDIETGLYNAAFRIYEGLLIIPMAIGVALMPRLSHSFHNDRKYFFDILEKGLKYIVVISVSVLVSGFILSERLVVVLFGNDYVDASLALKVLLSGIIFVYTFSYMQLILITMNKQKIALYISLFGLGINILINFSIIPIYGYIGAGLATVSSEFVMFITLVVFMNMKNFRMPMLNLFIKPILAVAFPVMMINEYMPFLSVYFRVLLINVCFLILLCIFKVFSKDEKDIVLSLLKLKSLR